MGLDGPSSVLLCACDDSVPLSCRLSCLGLSSCGGRVGPAPSLLSLPSVSGGGRFLGLSPSVADRLLGRAGSGGLRLSLYPGALLSLSPPLLGWSPGGLSLGLSLLSLVSLGLSLLGL